MYVAMYTCKQVGRQIGIKSRSYNKCRQEKNPEQIKLQLYAEYNSKGGKYGLKIQCSFENGSWIKPDTAVK